MNTLSKIIALSMLAVGLTISAEAKPNDNPAFLQCIIKLPDGQTLKGNGKNDLCLIYENTPDVIIEYKNLSNSLNEYNYFCTTENNEKIHINKKIFRVYNYTVHAFGYIYTGFNPNAAEIVDGFSVTNQYVSDYEPMRLKFKVNEFGNPTVLVVHFKNGRAQNVQKIQCEEL